MGKVMKAVMAKLAGMSVDGRVVSDAVKKRLVSYVVLTNGPQTFSQGLPSKTDERQASASHPSSGQGPQHRG